MSIAKVQDPVEISLSCSMQCAKKVMMTCSNNHPKLTIDSKKLSGI